MKNFIVWHATSMFSRERNRTYVMLEGLKENMPKAMALFEEILADAQVDKDTYGNLADDILKNGRMPN